MGRILVNHKNFKACLEEIDLYNQIGLDTETTGLHAYLGARLFSLILTTEKNSYYFNFHSMPDHLGNLPPVENMLPKSWLDDFKPMFNNVYKTWFIQNAKFDMHILYVDGLELAGTVICTMTMSRLLYNRLPSYSLAALGALIGYPKDDTVEKYISKHKLYTEVDVGKKKPRKDKHYDQVPFTIMLEYGLTDGEVVYKLGMYCLKRLEELNNEQLEDDLPPIYDVMNNEIALTKVLFKMERTGVLTDPDYIRAAHDYEVEKRDEYADKFYALTEIEFADSPTCFKEVFAKLGLEAGSTEKGNPSFSEENLPDNAVTQLIVQWRKHNKRAGTYWRNYIDLADIDDVIHCNFRQAGTLTGRMSSSDPNLQNVPKRNEDTKEYPVRQAFIPRKGYFFAMVDFDQMEYRLLLDVAAEQDVIDKILNEGLCVHQATANTMGVERDPAKTLNFMLLYGGGAGKLATALKVTLAKAKQYKSIYFRSLRKVQQLIKELIHTSKHRGYLVNWLGRRIYHDEVKPYAMPNHYVQGGCGDVAKKAMVEVANEYLENNNYKSRMLLAVHDEIVMEVSHEEQNVPLEVRTIMGNVYPSRQLKLTAGTDFSPYNWHEKLPYYSGDLTLAACKKEGKRYVDAWTSIRGQRSRCGNSNSTDYKYYGGKGVEVTYCTRAFISWYVHEAKNFKEDVALNVDRINHDKNYDFSNIRLITKNENIIESNKRRSKYNGETFNHA